MTVSRRVSVAHRPGAGGGRGGLPPAGLAVSAPRGARCLDPEQRKSAVSEPCRRRKGARLPETSEVLARSFAVSAAMAIVSDKKH